MTDKLNFNEDLICNVNYITKMNKDAGKIKNFIISSKTYFEEDINKDDQHTQEKKIKRFIYLLKLSNLLIDDFGIENKKYIHVFNKIVRKSKNRFLKKKYKILISDIKKFNRIVSLYKHNREAVNDDVQFFIDNIQYCNYLWNHNLEEKFKEIYTRKEKGYPVNRKEEQKLVSNIEDIVNNVSESLSYLLQKNSAFTIEELQKESEQGNKKSFSQYINWIEGVRLWKYGNAHIKKRIFTRNIIIEGWTKENLNYIVARNIIKDKREHYLHDEKIFSNKENLIDDIYTAVLKNINMDKTFKMVKIGPVKNRRNYAIKNLIAFILIILNCYTNSNKNFIELNEKVLLSRLNHKGYKFNEDDILFLLDLLSLPPAKISEFNEKNSRFDNGLYDLPILKINNKFYVYKPLLTNLSPIYVVSRLIEWNYEDKIGKKQEKVIYNSKLYSQLSDDGHRKEKRTGKDMYCSEGKKVREVDFVAQKKEGGPIILAESKRFAFPSSIKEYMLNVDKLIGNEYIKHAKQNFESILKSDRMKKYFNPSGNIKTIRLFISNYNLPDNYFDNSFIFITIDQLENDSISNPFDNNQYKKEQEKFKEGIQKVLSEIQNSKGFKEIKNAKGETIYEGYKIFYFEPLNFEIEATIARKSKYLTVKTFR